MTLQATRDLLEDERSWVVAARVALLDGQTSHWERSVEGAIIVSVLTLQHSVPLWAILCGGDIEETGFWSIPAVDTEVMITFEGGDIEGDAYISSFHGHGPVKPRSGGGGGEIPGGDGDHGSTFGNDTALAVGSLIELRTHTGAEIIQISDGAIAIRALNTYIGGTGPVYVGGSPTGSQSTLLANNVNSAVSSFTSALDVLLDILRSHAGVAGPAPDPTLFAACTAMIAASDAFATAMAGAVTLQTKVK